MTKKLMMVVATLAVAIGARAETETFGGYTWTYRILEDDTAEIYKGSYSAAISPAPTGTVTIPSTLGGKTVKSIGSYAFYNCNGLSGVIIGDGVTSIGSYAFTACNLLMNVTLPDSMTNIGEDAFSGCSSLSTVTIPAKVMNIGSDVFIGCRGLTSITVDNANSAYSSVNGLLLTKDGRSLLQGVSGSVTIPNGVTSISKAAFSGRSVTSVLIPDSVMSIGEYAFSGCYGLASIVVDNANSAYSSVNGLLLTKDGRSLVQGVNGSVTIPNGVTRVCDHAFLGCSALTSVTIPEGVTSIASYSFGGCTGLTGVIIPDSVTSIGDYAFSGCSALMSVVLPKHLENSVNANVFSACPETMEINYRNELPTPMACTVTFDANGGSGGTTKSVLLGSAVGELPTVTWSGYTFEGWFTAADGGDSVTVDTIVAADVTFYAHWIEIVEPEPRSDQDPDPAPTPGEPDGPEVPSQQQLQDNSLLHRWSLNGTLTDSVTGESAMTVGDVTTDGSSYILPGGSGYISLGDVYPTNATNLTIEIWATQISAQYYSHIFHLGKDYAQADFCMEWSLATIIGCDELGCRGLVGTDGIDNSGFCTHLAPYTLGTEFHISVVVERQTDGRSKVTYGKRDSVSGEVLKKCEFMSPSGWSLAVNTATDMYLGHNPVEVDAHASYNEMRIWSVALSDEELKNSVLAGPDADLGESGLVPTPVVPAPEPTTWYVDGSTGADSNSGTTESSAKKTIQAAIDASVDGDTILVAPGMYAPISTDDRRITIQSKGGALNTIIDGEGASRCVDTRSMSLAMVTMNSLTNTVVRGFTLKNGNPCSADNVRGERYAGGGWGGLYYNCIFDSNSAPNGGGGACIWGALFDCLVVNCSARNGGACESCVMRNCTFVNNSVRDLGVIGWNCAVMNCIVYGNSSNLFAYMDTQAHGEMSLPRREDFRQENNFVGNPQFIDAENGDYRLAVGSPCIDAGDNSYVMTATDLAGNARIANGKVDIGCYEYGSVSVSARYCVIDLSAGSNADVYPVTYLETPPDDGFNTDEYKTTRLVLRRIDPGSFKMCGEYDVTLTKPYYIGLFEVTQKQYELVMGANPSCYKGDMRPVEQVSWNMVRGDSSTYNWPGSTDVDSASFIGKMRARTELDLDLPTEAQWEYACMAGTTSVYNNSGYLEDDLRMVARYGGNDYDGKGGYSQHTTVGSYLPNSWGLYDMLGNVNEWCLDWFGTMTSAATDPVGPNSGTRRVKRSGGWWDSAAYWASSDRDGSVPWLEDNCFGFRLAGNPTDWTNRIYVYTVTFGLNGADGTAPAERKVAEGSAVGELPDVTREGYYFDGWFTAASGGEAVTTNTVVTADVTFYAHWSEKFPGSLNDGLVAYYPFDGNADDASGNGYDLTNDGAATLTDGHNGIANGAYVFSGTRHLERDPALTVAENFSFSLWFTTTVPMSSHGSSGTAWNPGNDIIHSSFYDNYVGVGLRVGTDGIAVVEHASCYRPNAFTYRSEIGTGWHHVVVTVSDGGNEVVYLDGEYVGAVSADSSRKGVRALILTGGEGIGGGYWGYYTGCIDDVAIYNRALSASEVKALYDGTAVTPVTYTVTFDLNGADGAVPAERQVTEGAAVGELPDVTRTGYSFDGWYTAAEGGTQIGLAAQVTEAVTYYAQWTANQYTVTFDANGGEGEMDAAEWTYDAVTNLDFCGFTRIGYTFAGWATNATGEVMFADGSIASNLTATVGGTVTLFAQWTVNEYTVTFDANDGEGGKTVTQDYGTALVAPTVTWTGYTFKGWQPVLPETVPASNATYTAQWTVNRYTVTFDANGGDGGWSRSMEYGAALSAPTVTRPLCTFEGWTPAVAATVPAENVTYTARWSEPCYDVLDEDDVAEEPYEAAKAVTLMGAVYDDCDVVGVMELKLGKVNAKKKSGKVSGSFTGLDGKKISIKAVTVTGIDGSAPVSVSLAVKGHGTMDVTIGGSRFAGSLGGKYHVQSAAVGGAWAGGTAKATVDSEISDLARFPGTLLTDFLPDEETATVKNGKWTFAKAASVKWAKPKKGAALPELYDEASGKGLIIDTSKGKTNLSGLKLTYTPKKGTFKGSFKVYALEGSGKKAKLKKYTVNVTGFVVDGVGYGTATCKKPSVSWTVTVE